VLLYREAGELEVLNPEETAELWAAVTAAVRAVKAAYRPGDLSAADRARAELEALFGRKP